MAQALLNQSMILFAPWDELLDLSRNVNVPLPHELNSPLKYKIFVGTTTSGLKYHGFLHRFMNELSNFPDIDRLMLVVNMIGQHLRAEHGKQKTTFVKVTQYFRQTLQFINAVVKQDIDEFQQ